MDDEDHPTNFVGNYSINSISKNRRLLSEIYDEFLKKHYMTGFFEVDVTLGKKLIKQYQSKTGEKISSTGWIANCISKAVSKYPEVNSYRSGKHKVIQFEDIDIIIMIEREVQGKVIPVPYSIRKTQIKDLLTISREIRFAQEKPISEEEQILDQGLKVKFFNLIPKWIRRNLIRRMIKDPIYIKKQGGLIVVTAVGMFTNTRLWVGGFGGITTLNIALGGITKRLIKIDNDIVEHEFLQITAHLDHDIVDGGPATRFQAYVVELIEKGYGLDELDKLDFKKNI
jgi:pyruvate/2-oxoglutarate dehydrogenase complex dihydrolipoamide acyltransferase (E2) component